MFNVKTSQGNKCWFGSRKRIRNATLTTAHRGQSALAHAARKTFPALSLRNTKEALPICWLTSLINAELDTFYSALLTEPTMCNSYNDLRYFKQSNSAMRISIWKKFKKLWHMFTDVFNEMIKTESKLVEREEFTTSVGTWVRVWTEHSLHATVFEVVLYSIKLDWLERYIQIDVDQSSSNYVVWEIWFIILNGNDLHRKCSINIVNGKLNVMWWA